MEKNRVGEARNSDLSKVTITSVNLVEARIDSEFKSLVYPCLSFGTFFFKKKTYEKDGKTWVRKERVDYRKAIFSISENFLYFPTGLIPRLKKFLASKGVEVDVIYEDNPAILTTKEPSLSGIQLRPDQIDLIRRATSKRRGVIVSPTGSGKTILQLAIISQYSKEVKILILTHTIGIVKQTIEELRKFGFTSEQVGDGNKPRRFSERIVVGTVQTFCKLPIDSYINEFDIVMVDEAHHVSKMEGQYAQVLANTMSPIRLGFTATLPTEEEAKIALESFIGPLIESLSIEKAVSLDILARPRVRLLKSKENPKIKSLNKYPDVYQKGIVENKQRNLLIAEELKEYVKKGKSCLVLVKMIEHGYFLQEECKAIGLDIPFVQGLTKAEDRETIKIALEDKKHKAVICTTVWREGINIPSLDVIINAAGGKSEIMTLQGIGRGLRKTEKKDEVIILDIFDPSHNYLISHFGERITLYMEQGWL